MTIDSGTEQILPLHQAVFLKDGKRLQQLIESEKYDIDEKDKFGNSDFLKSQMAYDINYHFIIFISYYLK